MNWNANLQQLPEIFVRQHLKFTLHQLRVPVHVAHQLCSLYSRVRSKAASFSNALDLMTCTRNRANLNTSQMFFLHIFFIQLIRPAVGVSFVYRPNKNVYQRSRANAIVSLQLLRRRRARYTFFASIKHVQKRQRTR